MLVPRTAGICRWGVWIRMPIQGAVAWLWGIALPVQRTACTGKLEVWIWRPIQGGSGHGHGGSVGYVAGPRGLLHQQIECVD